MTGRGVPEKRFGAAGYADIHPLATNATDNGRARNRRVEVVLQRLHAVPSTSTAPSQPEEGLTP